MTKNPIVVGNWKMNLTLAEAVALAQASARGAEKVPAVRVGVAPSAPFLFPVAEAIRFRPGNFFIASQTVSPWPKGAYTGDVAGFQLKGAVDYAIIGHSEQRRWHGAAENVSEQIARCREVGLTPLVCFGEAKKTSRLAPAVLTDLKRDLAGLSSEVIATAVFAYEPIWAIGTGDTARPSYVQNAVSRVAEWFKSEFSITAPILYGGSVTAQNATGLSRVPAISGFLVGSASLHAGSFLAICQAAAEPL